MLVILICPSRSPVSILYSTHESQVVQIYKRVRQEEVETVLILGKEDVAVEGNKWLEDYSRIETDENNCSIVNAFERRKGTAQQVK